MTSTRKSFSKFIRHPGQYPLQLTRRDLAILQLIHEYRFIPSDHITSLIPGDERVLLVRLQRLFHHGYTDRLADRRIRTRAGSERMVYAITNKAADLLAGELGIDVSKSNFSSKNRSSSDRHIKHTLMVGKFRTAITLITSQRDDLLLQFWKENRGTGRNLSKELSVKVTIETGEGREEPAHIIPDAFLCIEDPEYEHFLYLEADRSTMTNDRFVKKLKAYWAWWKQGGSKKKHDVENFRVLTVTQSYQRRDNLRAAAIDATPVKGGSGMFWFCCEKDYQVSEPSSILSPIWVRANDKTDRYGNSIEQHSLLE